METSDRELIRDAFSQLRFNGVAARMNFACCSSCGVYELNEILKARNVPEGSRHYAFWNNQAESSFTKRSHKSELGSSLYLQFGESERIGALIVECLLEAGFPKQRVEWDGSMSSCVRILAASEVPVEELTAVG